MKMKLGIRNCAIAAAVMIFVPYVSCILLFYLGNIFLCPGAHVSDWTNVFC